MSVDNGKRNYKMTAKLSKHGIEVQANRMPETHEKRTETHACDLISRQAAIDALIEWYGCEPTDIGAFENIIEKLPSAQPDMSEYSDKLWKAAYERGKAEGREKRKKGKWMPLQLSIAYPPYQCSCCFGNAPMVMVETGRLKKGHLEALLTDFCPNCGADMRGEQYG